MKKNMDTCSNIYFLSFAWLHCFCFQIIILIYRWISQYTLYEYADDTLWNKSIYMVINALDPICVFHKNW